MLHKCTFPLTNNVSTTTKSAALSILAWLVYRNPINAMGAARIIIVFMGSMAYTFVRMKEIDARKVESSAEFSKDTEVEHNKPTVSNS